MKAWFDRKFTKKQEVKFKEGDLVMFEITSRRKEMKASKRHWIGPCEIIREREGSLFDLEYSQEGIGQKFFRVHPEYMKLYRGQVS